MTVRTACEMQKAIHYSLADALRGVVDESGGPAVVGQVLRPELDAGKARTWLNHCLDEDRNDKLSLEQIEILMEMGRKAGAHDAISYLCRRCSYRQPEPIEPADRQAELLARLVDGVEEVVNLRNELAKMGAFRAKVA